LQMWTLYGTCTLYRAGCQVAAPTRYPSCFIARTAGLRSCGTGCGVWTTSTAKPWASTSCAFNTAGRWGMPLCRALGDGLWEVRTSLPSNRIARVLFSVRQGRILVLHGFIKKTQKTPPDDLALARRRNREFEK
jgi:hypothetical protein